MTKLDSKDHFPPPHFLKGKILIHLDFETYSELDLKRVGAFKYAEHSSTEVLVMCYAFNNGPVRIWTPYLNRFSSPPQELFDRLENGEPIGAHNAQFEYVIWNSVLRRKHLKRAPKILPKQIVSCTAARSAMCSLPRSLERSCAAMNTPVQKDKEGAKLLKLFAFPRKPTKKDTRTRITPRDEPQKFHRLIKYCGTDVRSERALHDVLPPLPQFEREAFLHDLQMNRRGIPLDLKMIRKASGIVAELERRAVERVNNITGGINPTQRDKMLAWLNSNGLNLENLQANTIKALLLKDKHIRPKVREVLELRMEASKVSTKKLASMMRVVMNDMRARGMLLYYGAHTGRAAGKILQPQNMIRGLPDTKEQIALMRLVFDMFENGADADVFEWVFDRPLTSIAQCMRGFICAAVGNRLLVIDYAQIEARLLCWLADEESAVQEYRDYDAGKGHDRYVLMAAFLWQIKPEEVSKDQRRIAKNLVLGCGFGLGDKKFIVYCEKNDVIIDMDMSKRAVRAFREKHPCVVAYWRDVENCAIRAVQKKGQRVFLRQVSFYCDPAGRWLTIRLPSGRDIYYPQPKIKQKKEINRYTGMPDLQLTFMDEIKGKWMRVSTWGGRIVENIVQGTARDIMHEGCMSAERGNYPIMLIVHDELISEIKVNHNQTIDELKKLACKIKPWINGCPIAADGFETLRYRKG